jgi:hypothetical protein
MVVSVWFVWRADMLLLSGKENRIGQDRRDEASIGNLLSAAVPIIASAVIAAVKIVW